MNKPIIFLDMDGCLASQGKIWREDPKFAISEQPPWTAERIHGPGNLSVYKTISDHDSWAIDHFKEHAHIVIISGDERINRAWSERRDVPFIFTAQEGFHQDKWRYLVAYMFHNHYDRLGAEPPNPEMAAVYVKGLYYYFGDAMPDWKCLENAKRGFVPKDASEFVVQKIRLNHDIRILNTKSGHGCFEAMAWILVEQGVLPSV